ncbi:hypothetical protein [Moorena sp. SIOASIH]|nr:hypothetical protein [Moorena sp. SIOASIH]
MQPIPQQQSLNKWAKQLGKTSGQDAFAKRLQRSIASPQAL